jgi:hypothetical protein
MENADHGTIRRFFGEVWAFISTTIALVCVFPSISGMLPLDSYQRKPAFMDPATVCTRLIIDTCLLGHVRERLGKMLLAEGQLAHGPDLGVLIAVTISIAQFALV